MPTAVTVSLYRVSRTTTDTGGKTTAEVLVGGPYPARLGWTKPQDSSRENQTAGLETRRRRLLFIDDLSAPVDDGLVVKTADGLFRGTIEHHTKRAEGHQCYVDAQVDRL